MREVQEISTEMDDADDAAILDAENEILDAVDGMGAYPALLAVIGAFCMVVENVAVDDKMALFDELVKCARESMEEHNSKELH